MRFEDFRLFLFSTLGLDSSLELSGIPKIDRLLGTMALDLPSWRDEAKQVFFSGLPRDRGPLVPASRESRFLQLLADFIAETSDGVTNAIALFEFLAECANALTPDACDSTLHYLDPCNDPNCCGGTSVSLVKYVTYRSISRYIPMPAIMDSGRSHPPRSKWPDEIKLDTSFISELNAFNGRISLAPDNEPPNATFVTSSDSAPHTCLPPSCQIGTDEAARFVVSRLALPGFASADERENAGGIVAVTLSEVFRQRELFKPTAIENLAPFVEPFVPGRVLDRYGETWPLDTNLKDNDPALPDGVKEWILDLRGDFDISTNITVVGTFLESEHELP